VIRKLCGWRTLIAFGVILAILGTALIRRDIRVFRDQINEEFRNGSAISALTFARVAGTWLVRGNQDDLEWAARLMLTGSGLFVFVSIRGETVLDERSDLPEIASLDLSTDIDPDWSLGPVARDTEGGYVDVTAPITLGGPSGNPVGFVRIGFDAAYIRAQVRAREAIIGGMAVGSWAGLMLISTILVWVLKRRACNAEREAMVSKTGEGERLLRCGDLIIDRATCEVWLFDQAIQLTPKQYDLLVLLAQKPGKIFSDDDILAALWPDSIYAASGDVKQCVYMLRRRLGEAHPDPAQIVINVKGFGYKLEPPCAETVLRSS
jgi:DNA-binding winged helix-turn-helix (wHTH) protein